MPDIGDFYRGLVPGYTSVPESTERKNSASLVLPKATAELSDSRRTSFPGILLRWRRLLTAVLQQPMRVVRRQKVLLRHDTEGWA